MISTKKMDVTSGCLDQLEQQNNKALMHYRKLQANFNAISVATLRGANTDEDIPSKLSEMEADMRAMGEYLSFQIPPKHYNQIRRKDSTIASQVFNVAELAELILSFLDFDDILAMEEVNKFMRSICEQSPKLQGVRFIKPDTSSEISYDTEYHSPFEAAAKQKHGFKMHAECVVSASFGRIETDSGLPRIGQRWMKMLIRQPPLYSSLVSRVCARCQHQDSIQMSQQIMSNSGLSLGDLYKKAKELFAVPAQCDTCTSGVLQPKTQGGPIITTAAMVCFLG